MHLFHSLTWCSPCILLSAIKIIKWNNKSEGDHFRRHLLCKPTQASSMSPPRVIQRIPLVTNLSKFILMLFASLDIRYQNHPVQFAFFSGFRWPGYRFRIWWIWWRQWIKKDAWTGSLIFIVLFIKIPTSKYNKLLLVIKKQIFRWKYLLTEGKIEGSRSYKAFSMCDPSKKKTVPFVVTIFKLRRSSYSDVVTVSMHWMSQDADWMSNVQMFQCSNVKCQ